MRSSSSGVHVVMVDPLDSLVLSEASGRSIPCVLNAQRRGHATVAPAASSQAPCSGCREGALFRVPAVPPSSEHGGVPCAAWTTALRSATSCARAGRGSRLKRRTSPPTAATVGCRGALAPARQSRDHATWGDQVTDEEYGAAPTDQRG